MVDYCLGMNIGILNNKYRLNFDNYIVIYIYMNFLTCMYFWFSFYINVLFMKYTDTAKNKIIYAKRDLNNVKIGQSLKYINYS